MNETGSLLRAIGLSLTVMLADFADTESIVIRYKIVPNVIM
jgi:hypothetical protein